MARGEKPKHASTFAWARVLCPMCSRPLDEGTHMVVKIERYQLVISCYKESKASR